jgi:hypothetical protein
MPDRVLHRAVEGKTDDATARPMPFPRVGAVPDRYDWQGSAHTDRFRDRRVRPQAPRTVPGVVTLADRSERQALSP